LPRFTERVPAKFSKSSHVNAANLASYSGPAEAAAALPFLRFIFVLL
jgi:hypothetical protein